MVGGRGAEARVWRGGEGELSEYVIPSLCSSSLVGAPIDVPQIPNPSQETIEQLHKTYLEKLTQLFEDHKEKYGVAESKHLNLI